MRKRINPTRSEGQDGDLWELMLADIRGHIREYGNYKKLAELTGLSLATISNLAYAETKSPHMRTVTRIMAALGKGEQLKQAMKCEKPVSIAEARMQLPVRKKRANRRKTAKVAEKFIRPSVRRMMA